MNITTEKCKNVVFSRVTELSKDLKEKNNKKRCIYPLTLFPSLGILIKLLEGKDIKTS